MLKERLIPGILEEIEDLIGSLKLIPLLSVKELFKKTISDPTKHSFYVVCEDREKSALFLKVRIYNTKEEKKSFRHEIWLARFLKKTRNEALRKITSKYINTGVGKIDWLVKEYDFGKFLGSRQRLDKTLLQTKDISQVLGILKILRELPLGRLETKSRQISPLARHDFCFYRKAFNQEIKKYGFLIEKYISRQNFEKYKVLLRNHKVLLNKHCHHLAHGDFQSSNLLLVKNKVKIIDWDSVHINNPLYDPSFLWVHMWRKKKWRRAFIENFFKLFKKTDQEELFRIDTLFLLFIQVRCFSKYFRKKTKEEKRIFQEKQLAFSIHLDCFHRLLEGILP